MSIAFHPQGQLRQTEQYKFRKVNGLFVPYEVEFKRYEDRSTKGSQPVLTQHRVFTLKDMQVNEPIAPAVFDIQSMGLRYGDRMVDRIEHEMYVFDGKELVPANKFKLQSAAEAKRDDRMQETSINNMKQISLAMQMYHDAYKRFPPAASYDASGKPLLSWRVLLLPLLGENELLRAVSAGRTLG